MTTGQIALVLGLTALALALSIPLLLRAFPSETDLTGDRDD